MGFLSGIFKGIGKAVSGLGLGDVLGIGSGVMGLTGLLGAQRGVSRASGNIDAILNALQQEYANEESLAQANLPRLIASLTGDLNETLGQTGRGLGSALAGAGVYNSSAAAGALSNLATEGTGQIMRTQADLGYDLARMRSQNRRNLLGSRLGVAQGNLDYQRQNLDASRGGLASALGSLVQNNLRNRNVPNARNTVLMNGNQNGQLPNFTPPFMGTFGFRPQRPQNRSFGSRLY